MRLGCKGRAVIPYDDDVTQLRITVPHNHPPDIYALEKKEFFTQLRSAVTVMPGTLKNIYNQIAELYIVFKHRTTNVINVAIILGIQTLQGTYPISL